MLNAALDAGLLDFEAADAGEIDWRVVGVAASAERVEVPGASLPLEDIDAGGIHRIGRDREVETPGCLAGEAHGAGTCNYVGVSVGWVEGEVTVDDEHPRIVPMNRCRYRRRQPRRLATPRGLRLRGRSALALAV